MTIHVRRLSVAPTTIDEAAREVELVAATTGAAVERYDIDGVFLEVLEISTSSIDLSRASALPLLDTHRSGSLADQIGAVRSVRIENGKLVARVAISERHEAIWKDIKAGLIRSASIGYRPTEWRDAVDKAGVRTRTITKLILFEISLVSVPADPSATTRSIAMPTPAPATATTTPDPATVATPPAVTGRAAINAEIRALGATLDLPPGWADQLIDANATEDQARSAALDAMRTRSAAQPAPLARVSVGTDHNDPAAFVTRSVDAVYGRINPRAAVPDASRAYAGMTTLDLAREALRLRSVSTVGLSPADIIGRALHSTSDFPNLLGGVGERVLRERYAAAPAALKAVARQTTAKDFRAKASIQIGEPATLEKVNEHGEFTRGTIAEGAESYRVDTYGKIFGITRQALINDDLGAFSDAAGMFGQAAADFEAQFLTDLLTAGAGLGPLMADGQRLFHASHANFGEAAPLGEEALSAARLAMRRQTGLAGRVIAVTPKFLVVPPELETTAEKLLSAIQATTAADANVFAGKLELLVEPRLTDPLRWYVAADPATVPGLEYAYIQGFEGPHVETRAGFEIDGVETKVRLDFGAGFVDWRGWHTNEGDEVEG